MPRQHAMPVKPSSATETANRAPLLENISQS